MDSLPQVARDIAGCELCARLRNWCHEVAATRRRAFAAETYWGRPVAGFGDPAARLLLVGLAPAAHGANRTGRMFTGDRSGDFLFAALHRAGFASQPHSLHRDDGLRLTGAFLSASARCAPPANKPTPAEFARCRPYLERELALLPHVRVILALGGLAHLQLIRVFRDLGWMTGPTLPAFGHGRAHALAGGRTLLGAYHPSQQNTFTGRLTPAMLDEVLQQARRLAG